MTANYDVIVVGARCAGSPTAMLLARRGQRVLLVDRSTFPSDTLSTHFIHQPGVACLDRWGLLPEVAATGCPPVRSQRLDLGDLVLEGSPHPSDGIAEAYAVRRTVLDHLLIRAAARAGVDVHERFSVQEVVMEGGRVTGIRGRDATGADVTETARLVIGADGASSLVARSAHAPTYDEHPTLTCAYYSYWTGVHLPAVEMCPRNDRMIIAAPTNDGQVFVIVYWPTAEFHRVRKDIEGEFMAALDLAPALAEAIRGGTRTERFRGTGHLPNFFRRPFGDGWALVGDAGFHKDPILAMGITDAFQAAELLAEAVDDGLSGRRPLDVALAEYEQRRNGLAAQTYRNAIDFAHLAPPPPEMRPLMEALAHQPDEVGRFFGAAIGTVPADEFYAPANIARIVNRPAPAGV